MSLFLKLINQTSLRTSSKFYTSICKCSTNASYLQYDKDPSPKFADSETQKLLKSITRLQLNKIYRKRPDKVHTVGYDFMTTEKIEDELDASVKTAEYLLQMPPIVPIQRENSKVLSKDPGLHTFSRSKYVITDITYGIDDSQRTIVVRQTDGTLESADAQIRKRINQIYFPSEGRKIRVPRMFEPENLKRCLDRYEYKFVLDRMCVQFEPYEQQFHDVSSQTFQHINDSKQFDVLRSTRHFGPMSFFLAWHKMIDDLVIDMVERDYMQNAVEVICLMYNLHGIQYDKSILNELDRFTEASKANDVNGIEIAKSGLEQELTDTVGKSSEQFKIDEICLDFVDNFCKSHGIKKSQVAMCLQLYRQSNEEKRRLLEGLKTAHGVN